MSKTNNLRRGSRIMRTFFAACCATLAMTSPIWASAYMRESDIPALRLGQRVYVDDATCPTGQIKEIMGKTLTAKGVASVKRCVARKDAHPN